jgi:hypothetical protein
MSKSYFSLKLDQFKEKFYNFICHKKKVKALENLSSCRRFANWNYIQLLKQCLNAGFLEDEEEKFLDHMIQKNFKELEYLTWSHKTKWLKAQMADLSSRFVPAPKQEQIYMPFDRLDQAPAGHMPLNVVIAAQGQSKGVHA